MRIGVGAATAGVLLAGCGGGSRQDANEPSGSFPVDVVASSFPTAQRLAQVAKLKVTVKNAGRLAIPDVALTLHGKDGSGAEAFGQDISAASPSDLKSRSRPIWIVDSQPEGNPSAYTNTWTLGRLKPGATATFSFSLTPTKPGSYTVGYAVAAGLNGKARAVAKNGGGPVTGTFHVNITSKPRNAVVDTSGGG